MAITTLRCAGGELGDVSEQILLRTDLANPAAPIEVDYCEGEGWEGTGQQSGNIGGGNDPVEAFRRLARIIAADVVGEEKFTGVVLEVEDGQEQLDLVTNLLWCLGPAFSGGTESRAWEVAGEWVAVGFDLKGVRLWTKVGCWDADTAFALEQAGVTPSQARQAADVLGEQAAARGSEPIGFRGTDFDPMYKVCNGDLSLDEFLGAALQS